MSSADGHGTEPGSGPANELPNEVHNQLVEALMHLLIEKGVLTRNDALSVVQTVVQVQRPTAAEGRRSAAETEPNLVMLKRLYRSFEAVTEIPRIRRANFDNVRQLRPPVHGDRPEFPLDD